MKELVRTFVSKLFGRAIGHVWLDVNYDGLVEIYFLERDSKPCCFTFRYVAPGASPAMLSGALELKLRQAIRQLHDGTASAQGERCALRGGGARPWVGDFLDEVATGTIHAYRQGGMSDRRTAQTDLSPLIRRALKLREDSLDEAAAYLRGAGLAAALAVRILASPNYTRTSDRMDAPGEIDTARGAISS